MIQPVSAVSMSPPATVAPQDTPIDSQVEISPQALPAPTAAEASQFGDFLKNRIPEVNAHGSASRSVSRSKFSATIDAAMKHLSQSEARAHDVIFGPHGGSGAQNYPASDAQAGGGHVEASASGTEPAAAGPGSGRAFADQIREAGDKEARSTMMVLDFELESLLFEKASEKGVGSMNQLVQEK